MSVYSLASKLNSVQIEVKSKPSKYNPAFTGTVNGVTTARVGLGNFDNTPNANKQISTLTQNALDTKAPINNPTFTGTVTGITKAMVGPGNVANTSDADKPISSYTQNALDTKGSDQQPDFHGHRQRHYSCNGLSWQRPKHVRRQQANIYLNTKCAQYQAKHTNIYNRCDS